MHIAWALGRGEPQVVTRRRKEKVSGTVSLFHSLTQVCIAMEAEAILSILALCAAGYATLLASDALVFETAQTPHPIRKQYAFGGLAMATQFILTDSQTAATPRNATLFSPT